MSRSIGRSPKGPGLPRPQTPLFRADPETTPFFLSRWKPILTVLAAAAAVRVLQFLFIRANDPSFAYCLQGVDTYTYDQWALKILAGDWATRHQPVFYYGPIYPYFLALVYGLFGHRYAAAHVAQFLLGAAASAMVFLGVSQWFSRRVAWLGALFVALCPGVLFYESTLLPESITYVALAAFLWVMGSTQRRPERTGSWPLMGFCLGLVIIQRASALLCIGAVALWLAVCFRTWTWKRKTLAFALFLVGLTVPLIPTTLHNRLIGGKWVLVTSNGPNLLYIGNARDANGTFAYPPSFTRIQKEDKRLRTEANAVRTRIREAEKAGETARIEGLRGEVARLERECGDLPKKALRREILAGPGAWIGLLARKTYMFWAAFDPPDNFSYDLYRWFSPVMKWNPLGFALLAPLGLVGLALAARRWREVFPLYAFIATYCLAIVLVFVVGRYRLPILLPLSGFASVVVWRSWDWGRARRHAPLLAAAGAVALLVWLLSLYYVTPLRIRFNDFGMFASYYEKTDRGPEAIEILRRGEDYYLGWKPRGRIEQATLPIALANVRAQMARILVAQRDWTGAEAVLEKVLRGGQADAGIVEQLVVVYAAQGKKDRARALVDQARRSLPNDPRWDALLRQIEGEQKGETTNPH